MQIIPKKIAGILIAAIILTAALSSTAMAASWKPNDLITITVRVYDQTTGFAYTVGTDTCTKGDQNIQSDAYRIPQLTQFVDASKLGTVTKVVGNWYFPAHDSSVGATVNWSCNASTATMTYWVNSYNPQESTSYSLTYNANGGTGAPADQTGTTTNSNVQVTVSSTVPTRDGYTFLGWSTSATAATPSYQPGSKITIDGSGSTTLYAVWQEEPQAPVVAGNSTFDITKVFAKDYTNVPPNFEMTYSYTNLETNQNVTGTVQLTEQDDGNLKGTISVPYYKNLDTGTYKLSLTETNADVDGYDLSISGGNGGTVNGNTITYAISATTESTLHRTITNTYTKNTTPDPDPETKYTVTYTDGVEGETIFTDKTFKVTAGGDTPAFEGTPEREGYVFDGWSPEVSDTVTADVTYTAQWTKVGEADNDKTSVPGMDKKADGADELNDVTPGQTINFTLNSNVGEDMADKWNATTGWENAEYKLVFHDTLTGPITFNEDSVTVTLNGQTLDSAYYTLNTNPGNNETFTLTVDCVAALNANVFAAEDIGRAAVVVAYTATVDADAANGATVSNDAYVSYGDHNSATDTLTGTVNMPPTPPNTGGAGTLAFTLLGLTMTCGASAAFVVRRKRA